MKLLRILIFGKYFKISTPQRFGSRNFRVSGKRLIPIKISEIIFRVLHKQINRNIIQYSIHQIIQFTQFITILDNICYILCKEPNHFLALILNHKGRNLMNTKFCFSHTGIFGTISKITSVIANLLNTFIKLFFSIQGNRQIIDFLCS